jgi:energy-coupling factor transport system permease protein
MLPRALHPIAWWAWALGIAVAASRTTNLLLLALLGAAVGYVVISRRTAAPWSRAFGIFLRIGLVVIVLRTVVQALLVGSAGTTELFTLPSVRLPDSLSGEQLGGPVTAEVVLAAVQDGARLAVMLLCFGAANALASPARLLRCLPRALHELGVAIVVTLSVAPSLVTAVGQIRRARRLRARPAGGVRGALSIIPAVVEQALDRSLTLAAALDARGYGRRGTVSAGQRRTTTVALLGGLVGLLLGAYGLLDGSGQLGAGAIALIGIGCLGCGLGFHLGGRAVLATRYRPEPWAAGEWLTAGSGVLTAACFIAAGQISDPAMNPNAYSLPAPTLPLLAAIGILCALIPAHFTPPPVPLATRGEAHA